MLGQIERQHLRPLPSERFAYCVFARATVNIDYHVTYDDHAYSVPYQLRYDPNPIVELRVTAGTIEVLSKNRRVASHARSYARHQHTTLAEHMPEAHRKHLEWTPSRLVSWAGKVGINTQALVEKILASRPHPEQGYRTCLGLLRLTKKYGDERVEAASTRALAARAYSYRHVKSILEHGLDRQAVLSVGSDDPSAVLIEHENIRGPKYYN